MSEDIAVSGGIRLGQFLKLGGVVDGGGDVKGLLAAGLVRVNEQVETRRGRQLAAGDVVQVAGRSLRITEA
ncbi:RNA-binding S4 domain-containing protein [Spongisporangium articulatum]|uniref:RNA-binding S4 domain-containing protein n=1 Tax=Spongisporangium articulatum TaxID=3362603 RepID=A0ABW8AQA5_9ACTN